jgi:hypothetical protein
MISTLNLYITLPFFLLLICVPLFGYLGVVVAAFVTMVAAFKH